MHKLIASFVALLAVLMVVGCGSSNPMVGTWKMEFAEAVKDKMPKDQNTDIVAEFKADNTFNVKIDLMGRKDEVSGTYELKDKTLTMHQKMEGGKPSDETQTATMSDDMKSFTAPGMESMGKMVKQ
jgi:uncharacterized protein (TIGR03066 family)